MSVETAAKRTGKLSSKLLDMKFMKKPGDDDVSFDSEAEQSTEATESPQTGPDPGAWSMPHRSQPVKRSKAVPQLGYSEIQNTRFPVGRQLWKNGKCQDVRELEKEATPEIELDPELPSKKRKSEGRKPSKKHAKKK